MGFSGQGSSHSKRIEGKVQGQGHLAKSFWTDSEAKTRSGKRRKHASQAQG